jgi:hypothetical protein
MNYSPKDIRQTPEYAEYMKSIGWEIGNFTNGQAFIRKIPILGSVIKIQHPQVPLPYGEIDLIAKQNKAVFLKIEPFSKPSETLEK